MYLCLSLGTSRGSVKAGLTAYLRKTASNSRSLALRHAFYPVIRPLVSHVRSTGATAAVGRLSCRASGATVMSGATRLILVDAQKLWNKRCFCSHPRGSSPRGSSPRGSSPRGSSLGGGGYSGWSWAQFLSGALVFALYYLTSSREIIPEVQFPFFLQHVLYKGEVMKLEVNSSRDRVYVYLHKGAVINGREMRGYGPQFMFSISGVEGFEAKLMEAQDQMGISPSHRIPVTYNSPYSSIWSLSSSSIITVAIIGAALWYLFRRSGFSVGVKFGSPFDYMKKAKATVILDSSMVSTKFSDVAGMEEVKKEVMEFVDYLQNPKRYSDLGARIPKGALLFGPPGTGKTLLARAVASEASVPFLSIAGSDFVEVFAGVGSARVRDLFEQSRENAPCILYIDEIDAVGKSRSSGSSFEGNNEQENTLNQLLVEMDGINPLEGVVIMASTNRVDILDPALLRPGRFDRQISIDLPTLLERKAIFEVYLKKIVLEKSVEDYSSRLAALTPGKSGADIANIVNEAALYAARGKSIAVKADDFEYAVERVIAGMEKMNSTLSPEERRVVAFHESGHALVAWLLEHTDPVMKVSIIPRTKGVLGFAQHLPSDQKLYSTEQLFDRMCMTLGGRVAEAVMFKRISTGAQDDLEKVTDLAYRQVVELGMSPVIGNVSFPLKRADEPGKKPYSQMLSKMIDEEVRQLVSRAYSKAEGIVMENQGKLRKLAEILLDREVLNYSDLVKILGPLPYEKKLAQHQEIVELW